MHVATIRHLESSNTLRSQPRRQHSSQARPQVQRRSTAAHDGHRPDKRYAAAFPLCRTCPSHRTRARRCVAHPEGGIGGPCPTNDDWRLPIVTLRSLADTKHFRQSRVSPSQGRTETSALRIVVVSHTESATLQSYVAALGKKRTSPPTSVRAQSNWRPDATARSTPPRDH